MGQYVHCDCRQLLRFQHSQLLHFQPSQLLRRFQHHPLLPARPTHFCPHAAHLDPLSGVVGIATAPLPPAPCPLTLQVYLYLINYAKTQPDLAILAVNTFVKVLRA